jgi:hypothetical protein
MLGPPRAVLFGWPGDQPGKPVGRHGPDVSRINGKKLVARLAR